MFEKIGKAANVYRDSSSDLYEWTVFDGRQPVGTGHSPTLNSAFKDIHREHGTDTNVYFKGRKPNE